MIEQQLVIFDGMKLVARGAVLEVARLTKELIERASEASLLVFEEATGRQVELDLRGSGADVVKRHVVTASSIIAPLPAPGPGRPKLGVVGREVTLLPRHWEWLGVQPGGASIALRKLVESGMKANRGADEARQRQEGAYRFLAAMAGNLPGYEEVLRVLFAGDRKGMQARMKGWPVDVRAFALELAFAEEA